MPVDTSTLALEQAHKILIAALVLFASPKVAGYQFKIGLIERNSDLNLCAAEPMVGNWESAGKAFCVFRRFR